jgi:hypothetical protein
MMMMPHEEFLKSSAKVDRCSPTMGLGQACRESSAREMLLEKAESLRKEAHDLETLARELPPEGAMSPVAERALRHTVSFRLYR